MKSWWAIALGVVFGLLSAGIILLASQQPRGNAIALFPPPTQIPIQVHVSGEEKSRVCTPFLQRVACKMPFKPRAGSHLRGTHPG
jgi:hypothetical protein